MNKCGEEKELDKLRKTIEEFRAKAERSGSASEDVKVPISSNQAEAGGYNDSGVWSSPPSYPAPQLPPNRQFAHLGSLSPNSTINKRISSGSLSSMSSHASHSSVSSASSSGSSAENDHKQKKKRWLPLKSLSKGPRLLQSSAASEFAERDDSGCLISPTNISRGFLNSSLDASLEQATYSDVMLIMQEKDRRLTDAKLEALTTQHQLHQLQDQIAQMQHEMQLLRMENESLQSQGLNRDLLGVKSIPAVSFRSSLVPTTVSNVKLLDESSLSPQVNIGLTSFDSFRLYRLVSPASEEEGMQVHFKVVSPAAITFPSQHRPLAKITIGSVPVSRKASWEELDKKTSDLFLEYCKCIDGDHRLGLSSSSISFYKVGEQTRVPATKPPELLPCAFIIGNVNSVEITLKDATCNAIDLMAFKSLIPKKVLQHYINLFLQHKRIILYGPSGTGKTALAHSFASHVMAREKPRNPESAVFTYDVKQKGQEELKTQIIAFSKICDVSPRHESLPYVIIVENCFMLNSITDVFMPLINELEASKHKNCPFIIGTMLHSKHEIINEIKEFDWISCASNSVHVKDYLTRFLRRSMIESIITCSLTCEDEFQNMLRIVTWLPLCWHQVNRCLESNCAGDVTIGPRVFTSCPSDFYSSCSWFVQVWNYVIAPYVIAAIKKVRQTQVETKKIWKWIDPTSWVIESFPWNPSDMGCDNTLRLKKINVEDFDAATTFSQPEQTTRSKANQAQSSSTFLNKTLPALESNRFHKDNIPPNSPRRFHPDSGREQSRCSSSFHVTEVTRGRESNPSATVWHKHNSPLSSPKKSPVH